MVAYERNTGKPHPLSGGIKTSSTGKRGSGSVLLTDYCDALWYGTISIGTPAEDFTGLTLFSPVHNWSSDLVLYAVDFDTGSSDLFVPSKNCDRSCSGHKAYDASASYTSRDLNKTFALAYGDGSATRGKQYTDNVIISGQIVRGGIFLLFVAVAAARLRALMLLPYQAKSQTLGAATVYSGFESSRFPPDGLMGMAFQAISVFNASPPFQTLVSQNKETSSMFGFKLAHSGSELFLGGVNRNLYRGNFTWVNLSRKVFCPHKIVCKGLLHVSSG